MEEVTTMKNKVADGDEYFAVAHIFASFNDTFVVSSLVKRVKWLTKFAGCVLSSVFLPSFS